MPLYSLLDVYSCVVFHAPVKRILSIISDRETLHVRSAPTCKFASLRGLGGQTGLKGQQLYCAYT